MLTAMLTATLRRSALRGRRSYVNTSSSVAPDPKLMRSLTAVGQRLEVRALVVDAALFRRPPTTAPRTASPLAFREPPPGVEVATDAMLTRAVRDELTARGLDAIGKPWAVRARLSDARAEAAEAAGLEAAIAGDARAAAEKKKKKEKSAAPDVAAKYAARLAAKKAGGGTAATTAGAAAAAPAGDAALLAASKALARRRDAEDASRWRLGPAGLSNALAFAAGRSMSVALVARPDTTARELEDLVRQAGDVFDVVAPPGDDALAAALAALDLAPHRVLALVEPDALARARALGARTCVLADGAWEPPARRDRRPDFCVDDCAAVADVINDLNGHSFR